MTLCVDRYILDEYYNQSALPLNQTLVLVELQRPANKHIYPSFSFRLAIGI